MYGANSVGTRLEGGRDHVAPRGGGVGHRLDLGGVSFGEGAGGRHLQEELRLPPIGVWCDNTTELLVIKLRPGNAGSNTAADHIEVLSEAIAQIPAGHRRHLLIRAAGAGATHELLGWLHEQDHKRGRRLEYSVGFPITTAIQDAIRLIPDKIWTAALDADGDVRDGADVAEAADLLDLKGWPEGMRVIVRRELPHPGAQLSLFEAADGWRYQAFATNTQTGQLGFLEARHRAHARVEDRIRHAKDTGLGRFPSREFAVNTAWAQLVAIAADLITGYNASKGRRCQANTSSATWSVTLEIVSWDSSVPMVDTR
jgi:hypothetical protein